MPDRANLPLTLGDARVGFRGRIAALDVARAPSDLPGAELERRLIELGFVEGVEVEILHEGLFGRDPIAVRVAEATVALRRNEARAVLVTQGAAQGTSPGTSNGAATEPTPGGAA